MTAPLGYHDFLCLMSNSRAVFTDSGGIQEETTALGVLCLTLRDNTERPVTVEEGTNIVAGIRKNTILAAWEQMKSSPKVASRGTGMAGQRPGCGGAAWVFRNEVGPCLRGGILRRS